MPTPKESMEERLNEFWNEHDGTHFYKDEFKDFIQSEISLALEEQREKHIEVLNTLKIDYENPYGILHLHHYISKESEQVCKRWYGYRHDWRKCWYSEYVGEPVEVNAQLYGTKKCDRCGAIADGFAEKENWQPKYDNLNNLSFKQ